MAPRKPRCNFKDCKEAAQRIVGDCSFCNGHYCSKHRMLEAHSCTGLEDCKKESHARNADKLNSERTQVIKGHGVLDCPSSTVGPVSFFFSNFRMGHFQGS
ncbi:hypothetical protein BJX96DRAFT_178661 [Aspergillus floccosus]